MGHFAFGFAGPLGGDAPGIGVEGAATFAFALEAGLEVTYEWRTDVFRSYSGLERRASLWDVPREVYSGVVTLSGADVRVQRSILAQYASTGVPFRIGMPWEGITLSDDSSGTLVYVNEDAQDQSDFINAGQRVILVASNGDYLSAIIQSSIAGVIVLDVDASDYVRGSRIMPTNGIYLNATHGFNRSNRGETASSDQVEQWQVAARAMEFGYSTEDGYGGTGATLTTYDGHTVFDRGIDSNEPVGDSVQTLTEIVDLGGALSIAGDVLSPDWGRTVRISRTDMGEWQWLKLFLFTVRGQWKSFWLPSWRADLLYVSHAGAAITVGSDVDVDVWYPARDRLQIVQEDETITYAQITGVVGSVVTIDETLSASPIEMISWLEFSRLTSDEVVVRFKGASFSTQFETRVINQEDV